MKRAVGVVVALVSLGTFGWGLYHLMQIGSCGGDGAPPCPPGSGKYFAALFAGLFAAIGSAAIGLGSLSVVGIFATIGISSILVALNGGSAGDTTFPWIFGSAFLLAGMVPFALGLLGVRKLRRRNELIGAGGKGTAVVLSVQDTGVTINDNPMVKLRLRIEPHGLGEPFEHERRTTVSRLSIPRPGDRYSVVYDATENDEVFLVGDLERMTPDAAQPAAPAPPAAATPAAAPAPDGPPTDWVEQLARLNDLRLKGALSDAEFETAKAKLLS